MKKTFGIIILVLVTGGITYGVKTGVIGPGKNAGSQESSVVTEKTGRQESSEAGEGQRASRGRGRGRVSVEVAKVGWGKVLEKLDYVGTLTPRSSVDIYSKAEGRLESLSVDVGSWVRESELIARIEDDEIEQTVREAQASLRVARATLKGNEAEMRNLERQVERARQLFEKNFISRQELETAETQHYSAEAQTELARAQVLQKEALLQSARIKLSYTEIRAPLSGYVAKRFLDPGTMVKISTPILSLVEIQPVTTLISVVERDYGSIRVGQSASITVDAFAGQTFRGRVVRLSPVLDSETRTADVEIEIANPKNLLKPGMFARVSLALQKKEKSLVVPQAAIVRRGSVVGVFKIDDERRATFVPLEVGAAYDGNVEVVGGVGQGDQVVTLGAHLLEEGSRVRIVKSAGS